MHAVVVALFGLTACGRLGFDDLPDAMITPPCVPAVAVADLVAGEDYTCARLAGGILRCWGAGAYGQLGDGADATRLVAVTPTGLGAVDEVTASLDHTCARTGGTVSCWGRNDTGQLGLGDRRSRDVPVVVSGLPADIVGVTAGGLSSCAWTATGQLWCWGQDDGVGTGSTTPRLVTMIPGGVSAAQQGSARLRSSASHGCAIAGATTWCWGSNDAGQLGDGTGANNDLPVMVMTPVAFVELALGNAHSCGRTATGDVYCWGRNNDGQLGDGSVTNRPVPVRALVSGAAQIVASVESTCARLTDGSVVCWGDNDQLTLGRPGEDAVVPEPVSVPPASTIALGPAHGCALAVDGVVRCWGTDRAGQLSGVLPTDAVTVVGLTGVTEVDAGGDVTCARIGTDVQCWGRGAFGQLGDGTLLDRSTPAPIQQPEAVTDLSVGLAHACARHASGAVTCWGDNERAAVGFPPSGIIAMPTLVTGIGAAVTTVAAGSGFSCATPVDGPPWCWGNNDEGELGRSSGQAPQPTTVSTYPAVGLTTAGADHSCALTSTQQVFCSGRDNEGQIGITGNAGDVYTPLEVLGAPNSIAVAAGGLHTCAASMTPSTTWCWGDNSGGQLGDGTTTSSQAPVPIADHALIELDAGRSHTCGRDAANEVWCWGSNASGQLGDGTLATRRAPVHATQLGGSIAITVGRSHTCGLRSDGTVRCVGAGPAGQLGGGAPVPSPAPVTSALTCP